MNLVEFQEKLDRDSELRALAVAIIGTRDASRPPLVYMPARSGAMSIR